MAIYLSQRWRRQPTGNVGIRFDNPLASGLLIAHNFNGNSVDLMGRYNASPNSGYSACADGLGVSCSQTAYATSAAVLPADFTQLTVFNRTTTGDITVGFSGTSVSSGGYVSVNSSGTWYTSDGTGTFRTVAGASPGLGTHTCVTVRGSGSYGIYQYVDNAAPLTYSGTLAGGVTATRICNTNGTFYLTGTVLLVLAWNTLKTSAEVRELINNPWQLFAPQRRVLYFGGAAVAGGDVNVNLTGLGTTSAQGSVTPNSNVAVSGQAATSQQGTLTPAESVGLSGQAGTGQQGSVGPTTNVTLAGQAATTEQGTLTPVKAGETSVTLTGLSATGQQGTLAPAASVPLTGLAGTTQQGDVTPTQGIVVALTGLSATASKGDMGVTTNVGMTGNVVSIDLGQLGYPGQETAAPAKQVGAGRSRRVKRRRVMIGERAYWVSDSELPGLLKTMLERAEPEVPEAEEAPKPKTQPKVEREDDAEEIVARIVPQDAPEAEPWQALFERLQAQFQANEDAAAVAALVEARARLIREELDEDDAEFLMLVG